jgi:quercetin dioxygenase-like cupin family protein
MENTLFKMADPFSFASSIDYSAGGIVSKKVLQKETGNVTLFSFDQDQKLSEHTAPFEALVQVLEGEAEIIIGGNPNILTVGMSIIMPSGIPHAVNAIQSFKMLLTMIRS